MLNQTEIITAYLSMVLIGTQESDMINISAHAVEKPWEEMTVTWENFPSFTADPVTVTEAAGTTERHIFWDITSLVRQWIKYPTSNHGLALRVKGNSAMGGTRSFGSRESDAPPTLALTYTLPPIEWPDPTPAPLPPHEEIMLPVSDTAYLRWDGYESSDLVREDPGSITLSVDSQQYVQERRLLSFNLVACTYEC